MSAVSFLAQLSLADVLKVRNITVCRLGIRHTYYILLGITYIGIHYADRHFTSTMTKNNTYNVLVLLTVALCPKLQKIPMQRTFSPALRLISEWHPMAFHLN